MTEPTTEQIKKFWEWCGFKKELIPRQIDGKTYEHEMMLIYPDGFAVRVFMDEFPAIDLSNIFKYAVPMVRGIELKVVNMRCTGSLSGQYCSAQIQVNETGELKHSGIWDTPAHALFWAIWEVIFNEIRN